VQTWESEYRIFYFLYRNWKSFILCKPKCESFNQKKICFFISYYLIAYIIFLLLLFIIIRFACHSSEFYFILHIQDLIAYDPRGHAGLCVLRKCNTKTKKKVINKWRVSCKNKRTCMYFSEILETQGSTEDLGHMKKLRDVDI
jgi:hypothetical protein